MRESRWLQEIRTLDPERDCRRIVFLDAFCEFPFDTARSLELAFFKTFASPTIAALLDSTGEFNERGQKRYDDTDLLMSAFSEDGWDGDTGKRALRRMNQIHGRFQRSPTRTSSTSCRRWCSNRSAGTSASAGAGCSRPSARRSSTSGARSASGWRSGSYRETLAELERFNVEYEASRFRATEAGARLARSQQNVFLAWFPFVPNRLGARAISSMLDERVVRSLGLVRTTGLERRASDRALRLRALALRPLPARRRPRLRTTMRRRSYPAATRIEQLGPPPTASQQRSPSPDTPPTFVLRLSYGGPVI